MTPAGINSRGRISKHSRGVSSPGNLSTRRWSDCVFCCQTFNRSSQHDAHVRKHLNEKPFFCTICDKVFAKSQSLARHVPSHSDERPFECQTCGSRFKIVFHLQKHMKNHSNIRPFQCENCHLAFPTRHRLKCHQESIHDKIRSFPCTFCNSKLRDPFHLELHLRVHTGELPFKCDQCQKCFASKARLQKHSSVHLPDEVRRIFSCSICGDRFVAQKHLKSHMQHKHSSITPHECTVCQRKFKTKAMLTAHMVCHTLEKSFKCNICGSYFARLMYLKLNIKVHETRNFACEICSKTFTNSTNLRYHRRRHDNVRLYSCVFCGKESFKSGDLKEHIHTHLNEKPFICFECGAEFSSRLPLKTHLDKNHSSN